MIVKCFLKFDIHEEVNKNMSDWVDRARRSMGGEEETYT